MSNKHYAEWPIEESLLFLNLYLDGVKSTDQSILIQNIAEGLGRTKNAIKLRILEVIRILGGEKEFPNVTPNMVTAVEQVLVEREMSRGRMSLLF